MSYIHSLGLFPVSGKSYPIGLVAWLRVLCNRSTISGIGINSGHLIAS